MTINIVVNVTKYKGKLAIGENNKLLNEIPEDLKLFKSITTNVINESTLGKNVIVMGRKTWFSLPKEKRPFKNRLNIVITNNKELHKENDIKFKYNFMYKFLKPKDIKSNVYFLNMTQFQLFYKYLNPNVYIIGGSCIYKEFFRIYNPKNVYLTETIMDENSILPDTFFEPLGNEYILKKISDRKTYRNIEYIFLKYVLNTENKRDEDDYLNLCKKILNNGNSRDDRTGVGTISTFGEKLEFDISNTIPLLTTKRVPWKSVIEELLWFLRGDTDANLLKNKGVKIWNGNTSREFLDKRGLTDYPEGTLGPLYGWSMRFFGANYSTRFADTSNHDISKIKGIDQLQYIIDEIKNNPMSRRILMSYWNPPDFDKMVLYPCHYSVQFYVNNNKLDCLFNMRSSDVFLGLPFNIFSYAVLTYIIACKCDLTPGKLIYIGGDVHIYNNHIEQINKQITRSSRTLPKLILNEDIKYKDFKEITIDDFDIVGYYPHYTIKAEMAI